MRGARVLFWALHSNVIPLSSIFFGNSGNRETSCREHNPKLNLPTAKHIGRGCISYDSSPHHGNAHTFFPYEPKKKKRRAGEKFLSLHIFCAKSRSYFTKEKLASIPSRRAYPHANADIDASSPLTMFFHGERDSERICYAMYAEPHSHDCARNIPKIGYIAAVTTTCKFVQRQCVHANTQ
jgi:hypothetical protein